MKKLLCMLLAVLFVCSAGVTAFAADINADGLSDEEKFNYTVTYKCPYNQETKKVDLTVAQNVLFLYKNALIDAKSSQYNTARNLFADFLNGLKSYTLAKDNKPNFKYGASVMVLYYYIDSTCGVGRVLIYNNGTVKEYDKGYDGEKAFRLAQGANSENYVKYYYDSVLLTPKDEYWYYVQDTFGDNYKNDITYDEESWPEEYKTGNSDSTVNPGSPDNPDNPDDPETPDELDDTSNEDLSFFGKIIRFFVAVGRFIVNLFR